MADRHGTKAKVRAHIWAAKVQTELGKAWCWLLKLQSESMGPVSIKPPQMTSCKQCFSDAKGKMHAWIHSNCDRIHKACTSSSQTNPSMERGNCIKFSSSLWSYYWQLDATGKSKFPSVVNTPNSRTSSKLGVISQHKGLIFIGNNFHTIYSYHDFPSLILSKILPTTRPWNSTDPFSISLGHKETDKNRQTKNSF